LPTDEVSSFKEFAEEVVHQTQEMACLMSEKVPVTNC
jgi:hypothetical protein